MFHTLVTKRVYDTIDARVVDATFIVVINSKGATKCWDYSLPSASIGITFQTQPQFLTHSSYLSYIATTTRQEFMAGSQIRVSNHLLVTKVSVSHTISASTPSIITSDTATSANSNTKKGSRSDEDISQFIRYS